MFLFTCLFVLFFSLLSRFVLVNITHTDYTLKYVKDHVKVCRPVIIKLSNAADKHLIFSHLKILKIHNAVRRERFLRPQYETEHLPSQFQASGDYCCLLLKRLEKKTKNFLESSKWALCSFC